MSETALSQGTMKTRSEKLFEQYLDLNGFKGKCDYEPSISGKTKRPDYRLNYNGRECFFEVKELRKKPNEPKERSAIINPYSSLRKEINEARKKIKQFKDYPCSLVVFNIDDRQARLRPNYVFAAMLGNEGFEMDIDDKGRLVIETARNVFLDGGKMIDDETGRTQNTTISAIVVLEEFLDNVEIERAFREKERRQGRVFTAAES
jgi:hypothetical protein